MICPAIVRCYQFSPSISQGYFFNTVINCVIYTMAKNRMELKLYENIHTGPVSWNFNHIVKIFLLIILNTIYIQIKVAKAFKLYFLLSSAGIFPRLGCSLHSQMTMTGCPLHSFHSNKIQENLLSLRGIPSIQPFWPLLKTSTEIRHLEIQPLWATATCARWEVVQNEF